MNNSGSTPGVATGATPNTPDAGVAVMPRTCGSCALCCSGVLGVTVLEHEIGRGKPCPYTSGTGCTIHTTRPRVCRNFQCGWLRSPSPLPDEYRPDRAGFILLPARFKWNKMPVDIAVAADETFDREAQKWLENHCREQRRLLIFQIGLFITPYGPQPFRQEMEEVVRRGGPLPWSARL